jgi:hypothetical protein
LLAGFIAACVVVWQGYLSKQQIAFSTHLDLDKEWNSEEMIEIRQAVHTPSSDDWDHSRLEGILEFFEKFALMYKLSGDMSFIYQHGRVVRRSVFSLRAPPWPDQAPPGTLARLRLSRP